MSDDLVEELRDRAFRMCGPTMEAIHTKSAYWRAADEIERLKAELTIFAAPVRHWRTNER